MKVRADTYRTESADLDTDHLKITLDSGVEYRLIETPDGDLEVMLVEPFGASLAAVGRSGNVLRLRPVKG